MSKTHQQRRRSRRRRRDRATAPATTPEQLIERCDLKAAVIRLRDRIADGATNADWRLLAHCHYKLGALAESAAAILNIKDLTSQDHLSAGICYIDLKRWDDATAHLHAALRLSKSAAGFYWLAKATARDVEWLYGDDAEYVIAHLESAVDLSNCPPEAFLWLDKLLDWENGGDRHREILNRGLEQNPNSGEIRIRLADLLRYVNPNEAYRVLQPLLDDNHPPIAALWHFYRIEMCRSRFDSALATLERLRSEHADTSCGSGLTQLIGEVLLDLGRHDDAIPCFELELVNKRRDRDAQILALLGRARAFLARREVAAAIDDATAAIALWSQEYDTFPGCPSLIAIGAEDFFHEHEPDERLVTAFAGEQSDPRCADVAYCLRYLSNRLTKHEPSIDFLKQVQTNFDLPIINYDLSCQYANAGNVLQAVSHHLRFVCAVYSATGQSSEYNFFDSKNRPLAAPTDRKNINDLIINCLLPRRHDVSFVRQVICPLYDGYWRDHMIDADFFRELLDVASFLCDMLPPSDQPLFDKAYAHHRLGQTDDAEVCYRNVIERNPDSPSALHNLSLILEAKGCVDEALALSRRAAELVPGDAKFANQSKALDVRAKENRLAAQRHEDFLKTARERWPQLDYHKKRILSTLMVVGTFDDLNHLARLSGTGEQYIHGNWRKLGELGMVVQDENGKPSVNIYILDLVRQERQHAVATTIIRADDRIAFKPIFNSKLEYTVYSALIGLFPNHLVFPNMSLQTVFQYERLKELVDADTFGYFLMSQVDFCVTSTATYLPILAFEVDSPYHDLKKQQERDKKKNELFRVGGVPLLRLRAHGQPTMAAIRDEIIAVVRQLGQQLCDTDRKASAFVNVAVEIDFGMFGESADGRDRVDKISHAD